MISSVAPSLRLQESVARVALDLRRGGDDVRQLFAPRPPVQPAQHTQSGGTRSAAASSRGARSLFLRGLGGLSVASAASSSSAAAEVTAAAAAAAGRHSALMLGASGSKAIRGEGSVAAAGFTGGERTAPLGRGGGSALGRPARLGSSGGASMRSERLASAPPPELSARRARQQHSPAQRPRAASVPPEPAAESSSPSRVAQHAEQVTQQRVEAAPGVEAAHGVSHPEEAEEAAGPMVAQQGGAAEPVRPPQRRGTATSNASVGNAADAGGGSAGGSTSGMSRRGTGTAGDAPSPVPSDRGRDASASGAAAPPGLPELPASGRASEADGFAVAAERSTAAASSFGGGVAQRRGSPLTGLDAGLAAGLRPGVTGSSQLSRSPSPLTSPLPSPPVTGTGGEGGTGSGAARSLAGGGALRARPDALPSLKATSRAVLPPIGGVGPGPQQAAAELGDARTAVAVA
jgi:hypothetical protein